MARHHAAFLFCLMLTAGVARAENERPAESPAFQGHAAEMAQRAQSDEQRRRRLYFDPVDVEIGQPGLPCDHLVRRKPDAISGPGFVVLGTVGATPAQTARVWFPPGTAADAAAAEKAARGALATRAPAGEVRIAESQRFLWCR